MTAADNSCALAAAVALGLPPCGANKPPAIPGPGGRKHATADPAGLRSLWRDYPDPLIGVPMGEASGLNALDVDGPRHPGAAEWWPAHRVHLPQTKMHTTRSGGVHVPFAHAISLRCSAGMIAPGIDVRSSGGFIVQCTGIPFVRIGRSVRYRRSDVIAFLDALPRRLSTAEGELSGEDC